MLVTRFPLPFPPGIGIPAWAFSDITVSIILLSQYRISAEVRKLDNGFIPSKAMEIAGRLIRICLP